MWKTRTTLAHLLPMALPVSLHYVTVTCETIFKKTCTTEKVCYIVSMVKVKTLSQPLPSLRGDVTDAESWRVT